MDIKANKQKLAVGILLDSFLVSAWFYKAIERIVTSDFADITFIVLNTAKEPYKNKFHKVWDKRKNLVYFLLRRIDEFIFRPQPSAVAEMDLRQLLENVKLIQVEPVQKKFSDYFNPADIDQVKKQNPDILIRMGFRILRGEILSCPKYGVWSYHHGDNFVNRGGPPGFWEALENWPETGSILQILNEELDGGYVLYRSWSLPCYFSPTRTKNEYFWTSASFLPRQMKRLYDIGKDAFFKEVEEKYTPEFDFYSKPLYKQPLNGKAFKLMFTYFGKIFKKIRQDIFYIGQWYLMYDTKPGHGKNFRKFKKIIPPKDRFWADPHVVKHNDRFYIFIEENMYKLNKAHISVMEFDSKGKHTKPVPVLEKDYHLSYPFVLQSNETYYMIPDSSANKTIELYECKEFPNNWEFKMNLMENIHAVDATPFFHNEKWWLFVNMAENEGGSINSELFLFFADTLLTKNWTPHPMNPIISDTKKARPAGKIFKMNGKLYRPSQNCSYRYGYGFNISHILTLSETEYAEKIITLVNPDWEKSIKGVHTFSQEANLTVIDAFKFRRKIF